MSTFDAELQAALAARRTDNLYRQRRVVDSPQGPEVQVDGRRCHNFCSNDYLGLAAHPAVTRALAEAAPAGAGSGASHLVCGHSRQHHALEQALAEFTGRERALVFSTGYMANLGILSALVGRGDAVFEDKLNHASLLDGGLLSGARFQRFLHNDLEQLRTRLDKAPAAGRRLIAVDGVFSMDGDIAPLPELARLAAEKNAVLMVDDAHGLGVLGAHGAGSLEHFGLSQQQVPVLMGTLGKSLGSFGAFVAGSEALIETCIQFARTYIYTTALPPPVAAASLSALAIAREDGERRARLQRLIQRFRTGAGQLDLPLLPSQTAIQPLVIGDSGAAVRVGDALFERGFWVGAIRPPTVPAGTARLRITLSAAHSEQQVDQLLDALAAVLHHG